MIARRLCWKMLICSLIQPLTLPITGFSEYRVYSSRALNEYFIHLTHQDLHCLFQSDPRKDSVILSQATAYQTTMLAPFHRFQKAFRSLHALGLKYLLASFWRLPEPLEIISELSRIKYI